MQLTQSLRLIYHMLMIDKMIDDWMLCIPENLEMTDERQVMFQPQH